MVAVLVTSFVDEDATETYSVREAHGLEMHGAAWGCLQVMRQKWWVGRKRQYLATSGAAMTEGSLVLP
jgi:hypothetical protein